MKKGIVLLTKDAMCKSYLPIYGNKVWKGKTPNIDELAAKGTVFTNAYTAAPSTAMAFLGFCTGKFAYELDNKKYVPVENKVSNTIFGYADDIGYKCHIIWDSRWLYLAKPFSECYEDAVFHTIDNLSQPVGSQYPHKGELQIDDEKTNKAILDLENEIKSICSAQDDIFLWIHLPHVMNGRISYGGDIDVLDRIVGIIRNYFTDDSIFISADHGNMNGTKGKICYGFDVYNSAAQIPLITPRIDGLERYNDVYSSVDFRELLFGHKITQREFVYIDSAYYEQPHRKLSIVSGRYKYIYNKSSNTEELYDIEYDPGEERNLISDTLFDLDRHVDTPLCELYFYPYWSEAKNARTVLRNEKDRIWRSESKAKGLYMRTKKKLTTTYNVIRIKMKNRRCK